MLFRSHTHGVADHHIFIEEVSTSPVDPLVAELEHFLQCVRGEEPPAVDGPQPPAPCCWRI